MANDSRSEWLHPLMMIPISRRRFTVAAASSAAMVAMPTLAQTPVASPAPQGDSDAVALLTQAGTNLAALDSFTFELETVQGESTIFEGFGLDSVDGAVQRPTDFQAEVRLSTPIGTVSVEAVAVGGTLWVQNPISNEEWMEVGSSTEAENLLNPDKLIRGALSVLQDAKITGEDKVGGWKTTMVEGTIDPSRLSEGVDSNQQFLAGSPVTVTFWINEDKLPVSVEFMGKVFQSESDDIIRQARLDNFNEPVNIVPPTTATPTA